MMMMMMMMMCRKPRACTKENARGDVLFACLFCSKVAWVRDCRNLRVSSLNSASQVR